jgi:hypothetical protein
MSIRLILALLSRYPIAIANGCQIQLANARSHNPRVTNLGRDPIASANGCQIPIAIARGHYPRVTTLGRSNPIASANGCQIQLANARGHNPRVTNLGRDPKIAVLGRHCYQDAFAPGRYGIVEAIVHLVAVRRKSVSQFETLLFPALNLFPVALVPVSC